MAQMHHVVGAILRDIAQSRVTSDIYSRDISRFYEQDALLRLFPIPRSEIKTAEIDLSFVVTKTAIDPQRSSDIDTKTASIFSRYSELIFDAAFDDLRDNYPNNVGWQEMVAKVLLPETAKAMVTYLLDYLEREMKNLIDVNDVLNLDLVLQYVQKLLDKFVYNSAAFQSVFTDANTEISIASVKGNVTKSVNQVLDDMQRDVQVVREISEEYMLDIEVSADKLMNLPEASYSSIKIITEVRNYTWSQVEMQDKKIVRRLVPE